MSDRITGILVMLLALAFFVSANQLEKPFFADPLGPDTFPMMIAFVAFIAGGILLLKPDAEPQWPARQTFLRLIFATCVLVGYAFALKPLGFLLPTAIAAGIISYLLHPNARQAVFTGGGLSVGLFVLFKFALGLSLFALPRWLMG